MLRMERYDFFMRKYKSIVAVTGAMFFAFALALFIFSFPPHQAAAEEGTTQNPAATASHLRPLEMHIANNGLILLRSARVEEIQGTTITVSTAWGSAQFKWIIRTNASYSESHQFGTKFRDRDGNKSSLGDVSIGNSVTITGMLDPAAQEPTVDADSFRLLE